MLPCQLCGGHRSLSASMTTKSKGPSWQRSKGFSRTCNLPIAKSPILVHWSPWHVLWDTDFLTRTKYSWQGWSKNLGNFQQAALLSVEFDLNDLHINFQWISCPRLVWCLPFQVFHALGWLSRWFSIADWPTTTSPCFCRADVTWNGLRSAEVFNAFRLRGDWTLCKIMGLCFNCTFEIFGFLNAIQGREYQCWTSCLLNFCPQASTVPMKEWIFVLGLAYLAINTLNW